MKLKLSLTQVIFLGMLMGIVLGIIVFSTQSSESAKSFSSNVSLLTDIFLRLIKMIIAPLVFCTIVVGIAKMGDIKFVGKVGGKTMLWFLSASIVSLLIGMVMMNLTKVGIGTNIPNFTSSAEMTGTLKSAPTFKNFIVHLIPRSFFEAMAENEILQVVVFSIFFGLATAAIGEKNKIILSVLDTASHIILKVTGYVMYFSPLAAFSGLAAVMATNGPDVLHTYLKLIIVFFSSIAILWVFLIFAGFLFLKKKIFELLKLIFPPFLLAFSTATSETAFPSLIERLKQFGCNEKIVTLVLPLGYSFNLDGSMMYTTFASLFIAQVYGVHLDLSQQITMLGMLMITSKGIAGTPRASLVIVTTTLAAFNIPEAGIGLLLGIDQIFDMARTGTNVIGNSIATTVICKIEKQLKNA